jgi:hypothetical protein
MMILNSDRLVVLGADMGMRLVWTRSRLSKSLH